MSYGFEIRDASSNIVLDSNDTTFRIVHVRECEASYSGSFTVSEFDSSRGAYYVKPIFTYRIYGGSVHTRAYSSSYNYTTPSAVYSNYSLGKFYGPVHAQPTLSWNNSTKTMTVTPSSTQAGDIGNSGAFTTYYHLGGHYDIVFFELS